MNNAKNINIALIGYGFVGKTFHAPLIQSVDGLNLAIVASRDEEKVKRALDARLASLSASPERRARIRAAALKEEERTMKRKWTVGVALAAVLVLSLTGAALAISGNLFELFAQRAGFCPIPPGGVFVDDHLPADAAAVGTVPRQTGKLVKIIRNTNQHGNPP